MGIIWDLYWFAKTAALRSDHGGQAHKWSWNRGQDKTSVLLRPGTSKLACGDHLGCILICQSSNTQKFYFRIICEPGIHGHFWVLQFWQINIDPKRSPHANFEVTGLNKSLVLPWPLFQDHFWAWPPWSLLSAAVLANQYRSHTALLPRQLFVS